MSVMIGTRIVRFDTYSSMSPDGFGGGGEESDWGSVDEGGNGNGLGDGARCGYGMPHTGGGDGCGVTDFGHFPVVVGDGELPWGRGDGDGWSEQLRYSGW